MFFCLHSNATINVIVLAFTEEFVRGDTGFMLEYEEPPAIVKNNALRLLS